MFPVRCFTCNKVIADKWQRYQARVEELSTTLQTQLDAGVILTQDGSTDHSHCETQREVDPRGLKRQVVVCDQVMAATRAAVMTELGLKRYCCRRIFLTHVDTAEKLLEYGNCMIF